MEEDKRLKGNQIYKAWAIKCLRSYEGIREESREGSRGIFTNDTVARLTGEER